MTRIILVIIVFFSQIHVNGQNTQGTSESKKLNIGNSNEQSGADLEGVSKTAPLNISKEPFKPPMLQITDLRFSDGDSNQRIDADEKTIINFLLSNTGKGEGTG